MNDGKIKEAYERPQLTVVGTFESITQSTGFGTKLDAAFPAGTPKVDLTFS
jgi:hypothetical protein